MTTPPAPLSAACGDDRHELCTGNAQDQASRYVFCGCTASGCVCHDLAQQRAADDGVARKAARWNR
ncbi:hypothetical protein P3T37_006560 [Kitasatospora sp. MAA4]|uniref:hypothetical protein n=1 Tax=Kitasatospora sp. MAA4 TaxID=3035093 RepID=UPI002473383C|nr:hypothetical protein [Kitasatospora sp. MAA4]MDH6137128.1 hypothetical protein [Kitasatospora sp. MAA4]